jgi:hypothetical protein
MLKYLQTVKDRLTGLKAGIGTNQAAWTAAGHPDTPLTVQAEIDALDTADSEIEALKDQLAQKQAASRTLGGGKNDAAEVLEKRAISIHATEPGKLSEYNISVPSTGQERPLPQKAIIKSVADDDDGIGFKIALQSQGKNVDTWEVQRGEIVPATRTDGGIPMAAPGPGTPGTGSSSATVLQTPYPFLRTTKKLVFVDDDVESGVRYFYRVRGVNSKGAGEWSEPVSAVQ